jgi:hypothetical protein
VNRDNFEQIFGNLLDVTSAEAKAQSARRVEQQLFTGGTREGAQAIENAFTAAIVNAGREIGKAIDTVKPEYLMQGGLLYILRGVVANLSALEDTYIRAQSIDALAAGDVVIMTNGAPDCDCLACSLARDVNEQNRGRTH